MKKVMILIMVTFLLSFCGKGKHAVHWGYEGEGGPANWGKLDPKFKLCSEGKSQSPIDISSSEESKDLPDIQFNYNETAVKIVNNGHTIQVNYAAGSTVKLGDQEFDLLQFHFHTPSENKLNGAPLDMEMHLVHKDKSGNLAVVAVLFKKGAENAFLKKFWDHLPSDVNKEQSVDVQINATESLPESKSYYNFSGSLTTPPCSEGVNWNVMATPVEVSEEQFSKIHALIHNNARPVQPLNGRVVKKK